MELELTAQAKEQVKIAVLELKRLGVELHLYKEANSVNYARDSTIETAALERADSMGFIRAINYIFTEMINDG